MTATETKSSPVSYVEVTEQKRLNEARENQCPERILERNR